MGVLSPQYALERANSYRTRKLNISLDMESVRRRTALKLPDSVSDFIRFFEESNPDALILFFDKYGEEPVTLPLDYTRHARTTGNEAQAY